MRFEDYEIQMARYRLRGSKITKYRRWRITDGEIQITRFVDYKIRRLRNTNDEIMMTRYRLRDSKITKCKWRDKDYEIQKMANYKLRDTDDEIQKVTNYGFRDQEDYEIIRFEDYEIPMVR